ncbi:MAG: hypothetical protein INF43_04410, partial [Alphaproteobacteria bacterium]|nr:hypothetical protein [Alphaproteobacteria bacterium]
MGLFNKDIYTPKRPFQLAEELPYFEFNETEGDPLYRVHLLKDGGLGVAWKCPVPASYSYDNGYQDTVNELRTFLESLPQEYEAQLIITSHNNLTKPLQTYLEATPEGEKPRLLRQSRAEKIRDGGARGYAVSERGYTRLRETYMIVTLRSMEMTERTGLLKSVFALVYRVAANLATGLGIPADTVFGTFMNETMRVALVEFREALMAAESTLSDMFDMHRMSLAELKEHFWTAYAPSYKDPVQKITLDPLRPFDEQVFPLPIENEFDIIKIGADYHGTIMLAMMPDTVATDYLGMIRRTLNGHTTFFCNLTSANQQVEKVKLTLAASMRRRVAGAFNKEEAEIFAQEASDVKAKLFTGRRII